MPDGMMIKPTSDLTSLYAQIGGVGTLSTANGAVPPIGAIDAISMKFPQPNPRLPRIVARIYQRFLISNLCFRGGDLKFSDIDGTRGDAPIMQLRCADGFEIHFRGEQRSAPGKHPGAMAGFFTSFRTCEPHPGTSHAVGDISATQLDRLVADHGGVNPQQLEELRMSDFVEAELSRLPDLNTAPIDERGSAKEAFFGPMRQVRKPAPIPTEFADIHSWDVPGLFVKHGAVLSVRMTGRGVVALGIEGNPSNVPRWLLDFAVNNAVHVINTMRCFGWNCWDAHECAWERIIDQRSPLESEIKRLLKLSRKRVGLGVEFPRLWATYNKFEDWRLDVFDAPHGLPWATAHIRTQKALMERAILKHRATDITTMRKQLQMLSLRNKIDQEEQSLIKRISAALLQIGKSGSREQWR